MFPRYPDRKAYNRLIMEREKLCEALADLDGTEAPEEKEALRAEIHDTDRAIFLTGVTSEYDG
jgi:hypothetical protein